MLQMLLIALVKSRHVHDGYVLVAVIGNDDLYDAVLTSST